MIVSCAAERAAAILDFQWNQESGNTLAIRQWDEYLHVESEANVGESEANVDTVAQPPAATEPTDAQGPGNKYVPRSPYESEAVTINIGADPETRRFVVPRAIVERHPSLLKCNYYEFVPEVDGYERLLLELELKDVHPDAGHTLVHYLHTEVFESLQYAQSPTSSETETEYMIVLRVYSAAVRYELAGLAKLAKGLLLGFDDDIPVIRMIEIVAEVFPGISKHEWFADHLIDELRKSFDDNETLFRTSRFQAVFGLDTEFAPFLARVMASVLTDKLADARLAAGYNIKEDKGFKPQPGTELNKVSPSLGARSDDGTTVVLTPPSSVGVEEDAAARIAWVPRFRR
ncbi:uncharacterized protein DSM5745_00981 [Aspergillus mulundensis]|uniref:BTB domain-containing protein n=1 Tax=Aspergillus mulundensis TaxID=1810919 RepID=A0A3D8T548_9EURO|nr:hypothetical protein DSM5745_00981 [Aspergillus mulundensis]RDW93659.1 hypothetical protein DSM5745_00981 [Aspergillus mulundensis]